MPRLARLGFPGGINWGRKAKKNTATLGLSNSTNMPCAYTLRKEARACAAPASFTLKVPCRNDFKPSHSNQAAPVYFSSA